MGNSDIENCVIPLSFRKTAKKFSQNQALGQKTSRNKRFEFITYQELLDKVNAFALALIDLGIKAGDRICLLSENSIEWVVSDLAIMSIGAVNVPVYPTTAPDQLAYIINNCQAKGLILENKTYYKKYDLIKNQIPEIKIITFHDIEEQTRVLPELISEYKAQIELRTKEIDNRLEQISPDDLCSIIYTSGTTSMPKGVMLSHRNFLSNARAITKAVLKNAEVDEFIELSFLPLSHVFERVVYYSLIVVLGHKIAFSEGFERIYKNLQEVKPNIFVSVPRIYEKVQSRVNKKVSRLPDWQKQIFNWAIKVGKDYYEAKSKNKVSVFLELERWAAQKLVYDKVKKEFGNNINLMISGGAALPIAISEYFYCLGLPILEGYGLTETSPVLAVNRPELIKFGTVGPSIPGVELKIAEDGEILAKGANIMLGYFDDQESTKQIISDDGWLHTGDVGIIDSDNYLKITDRKKEIIVMSNGKNVAPQSIEQIINSSEFISQSMIIGDDQKFISALVVPNFKKLPPEIKPVFQSENPDKNPELIKFFRDEIERITKNKVARFEEIKKFKLLNKEFPVEGIASNLSLKRKYLINYYQEEIQSLYENQNEKTASDKINETVFKL